MVFVTLLCFSVVDYGGVYLFHVCLMCASSMVLGFVSMYVV